MNAHHVKYTVEFDIPISQSTLNYIGNNSFTITNNNNGKVATLNNVSHLTFSDCIVDISNPNQIETFYNPTTNFYCF